MPPKRKNARSLITRPPTTASDTILFYHLNVKPYDVFCQWKPSPIAIPTHVLLAICDAPPTPSILASLDNSSHETSSLPDKDSAAGGNLTLNCAEQAYMFFKALYFSDPKSCRIILAAKDPGEQKALGQKVKGFSDALWDTVKSRVARTVNWYKFTHPSNQHMRQILLGIGYKEEVAEKYRKNWGENRLGKALIDVRRRIRECEARDEEIGMKGIGNGIVGKGTTEEWLGANQSARIGL